MTRCPAQASLTSTDRDWTPPAPSANWPRKLPEALVPEVCGGGARGSLLPCYPRANSAVSHLQGGRVWSLQERSLRIHYLRAGALLCGHRPCSPSGRGPHRKRQAVVTEGTGCRAHPLLGNLRPASASGACWNQQKTIPPTPGKPFLSLLQAALAPWRCRTPGLWEEGFLGASWGSEAVNITREGRGGGKRGPEASRAAASSPDSPGSSLCGVWSGVHETSARLEATQVVQW